MWHGPAKETAGRPYFVQPMCCRLVEKLYAMTLSRAFPMPTRSSHAQDTAAGDQSAVKIFLAREHMMPTRPHASPARG